MNTPGGPIGNELEIRSLRYFVVAAEELNFTRAAARLFVAQQALSREIQRLESRLGTPLFHRTTRRVTLTPEGERLLVRARELVAQHDAVWVDLVGPAAKPTVVDLMSGGRRTAVRILDLARIREPTIEFRGRHSDGTGAALDGLAAGQRDVVFGRTGWLDQQPVSTIDQVLVRLEPLALLLPAGHPLADLEAVPVRSLRGLEVDGLPSSTETPEWADLIVQFFALSGAHSTPPHLPAIGLEEAGYHLVRQGVPILASVDTVEVPGGVLRPLVDPVPMYAWSMAWRRGDDSARAHRAACGRRRARGLGGLAVRRGGSGGPHVAPGARGIADRERGRQAREPLTVPARLGLRLRGRRRRSIRRWRRWAWC